MNKAKRNKIPPISIFYLFFVSRVSVYLTQIQSISNQMLGADMVISIILALLLTILISLPVIFCYKKNKNPFDIKWLGFLYAIYFIFIGAVNISRFSYFASTTLNPDAKPWIFSFIITIFAMYAAYLGIEGIARFSAFALLLFGIAFITAIFCNIRNFNEINLYPVLTNKPYGILQNTFLICSNTTEVVMFLCISKRVNGYAVKPFVFSVLAAFTALCILIFFIVGVMGDSAMQRPFPLYTFFQLSKLGNLGRIDAVEISFWLFAVFLKTALLIYCASISIKSFKQKNKCIVVGIAVFISAFALSNTFIAVGVSPAVMMILFAVFSVLIPASTLVFKKRNRGEELIEKF